MMQGEDDHKTSADLEKSPNALFLVLEGGGAKAIAHVAAWEVLEPIVKTGLAPLDDIPTKAQGGEEFYLSGVAGTSAGAIMAALIAAGAKSTDLIDAAGRLPLCSALGVEQFTDLFCIPGWRRLRQFRFILRPTPKLAARLTPRWRKSDFNDAATQADTQDTLTCSP